MDTTITVIYGEKKEEFKLTYTFTLPLLLDKIKHRFKIPYDKEIRLQLSRIEEITDNQLRWCMVFAGVYKLDFYVFLK